MVSTIDCRPASARPPRSNAAKGVLKVGGAVLGGLSVLAVIGSALQPTPPSAPSKAVAVAPPPAPSVAPPIQPPKPAPAASASTDPDVQADGGLNYLSLKAEAEEKLAGVLTDDHGIRYRDVHTKLSTLDGGGIVAFCGEENSRSPMGGYGGFERFIASRSVATTESQMEPAEFAQAWSQFCESAVEGPQVWF